MMRNFTKIILGFTALAATFTANAKEWRVVSKTDFGGNDHSAPAIREDTPSTDEIETDLVHYQWPNMYETGSYLIFKATELATLATRNGVDYNLTNWGTVVPGSPSWSKGGDHTYPDDPNKGYYMAFDCPMKSEVKLYKHVLPVRCTGVKFKLEAYFAVMDPNNIVSNDVSVSIEAGGVSLAKATLTASTNTTWKTPTNPITWVPLNTEFTVTDPNINSVDFVVNALNCEAAGWDFGMDDITISVEQPEIQYKKKTYYYKKPAEIEVSYDVNEFNQFFESNSNVKYQWFKYDETAGKYTAISGAGGSYTSGSKIGFTINSFDIDKDNGKYRIIVGASSDIGDGNNESLCAIQKDIDIDQDLNELEVTICKDSTKVVEGVSLTPSVGFGEEFVTGTNDAGKTFGFTLTVINWERDTEPIIINYCKNDAHPTVGRTQLPDSIKKDDNGCPIKIREVWEVVSNVIDDGDMDLCKGAFYRNKTWDVLDETRGEEITFKSDGCEHKEKVFVHPTYDYPVDMPVCTGDNYDPSPIHLYTSKYHCDSILTPKVRFVNPVVVDSTIVKCPSDNFEFDGAPYITPGTDVKISKKAKSSEGCDSTTNFHIVILDGGVVKKDTLICREQILWGKVYDKADTYTVVRSDTTESGCPMDTIWTVNVVEISLKLRLFNNQTVVCSGQPSAMNVTLKAYEPGGKKLEPTYYWDPVVPSNVLSPTLYLDSTTTYTIYADLDLPSDIDHDAKGCHAKESVKITVNPLPVLTVDSINPDDRSVEYTITEGTMPYHMYLGSKDLGVITTNEDKRDHLPYGKHILQVQDSTGCTAEKEIQIEAVKLEPNLFFTPNGDGDNDLWKIKNIDVYPNATIKIFDRYGKLLHSGTGSNFENGWDGDYNGVKMPATDYWYEIDIDEIDTQYYGHFTLMR